MSRTDYLEALAGTTADDIARDLEHVEPTTVFPPGKSGGAA